jgi:threonine/homoserine/homoserine lactone efflux protein
MDADPSRDLARCGQGDVMTDDRERDRQNARQARVVAVVIAATMVVWMTATWLGGKLGWEARYAFLFDFLALAGFMWAMIVTFQIWRKRRDD